MPSCPCLEFLPRRGLGQLCGWKRCQGLILKLHLHSQKQLYRSDIYFGQLWRMLVRAVSEQPPSPTSFPLLCLVTHGAPAEAVSMDTGTTQTPSKGRSPMGPPGQGGPGKLCRPPMRPWLSQQGTSVCAAPSSQLLFLQTSVPHIAIPVNASSQERPPEKDNQ